ncbi:MAG: hypothetical protein WCL28_11400, partial [bacterium]
MSSRPLYLRTWAKALASQSWKLERPRFYLSTNPLVQKFLSVRIIELKMIGFFFLAQLTGQMVK